MTAAVVTAAACAVACSDVSRAPTAGFWYDANTFVLPGSQSLDGAELTSMKRLSRAEIDRAFAGLRIHVTDNRHAFWRVAVVQSLATKGKRQLPSAGESLPLGLFGGTGAVGFDVVASKAMHYAPAGAARRSVIEAIGRGIGRVAVHEFMHQMLGPAAPHNNTDPDSYEHGSPDRPSQYYGELHWTTAWPLLQRKFGT